MIETIPNSRVYVSGANVYMITISGATKYDLEKLLYISDGDGRPFILLGSSSVGIPSVIPDIIKEAFFERITEKEVRAWDVG